VCSVVFAVIFMVSNLQGCLWTELRLTQTLRAAGKIRTGGCEIGVSKPRRLCDFLEVTSRMRYGIGISALNSSVAERNCTG